MAFLRASVKEGSAILSGFGNSVALAGERVLVGYQNDPSSGAGINAEIREPSDMSAYAGAVYEFARGSAGYAQVTYLKSATAPLREKYFGSQIAADGDRIVVAARGEGAVYVFR